MTPLGHAVRLIDREQGDLDLVQEGEEAWRQEPFRRHVDEIVRSLTQFCRDLTGLLRRQ